RKEEQWNGGELALILLEEKASRQRSAESVSKLWTAPAGDTNAAGNLYLSIIYEAWGSRKQEIEPRPSGSGDLAPTLALAPYRSRLGVKRVEGYSTVTLTGELVTPPTVMIMS